MFYVHIINAVDKTFCPSACSSHVSALKRLFNKSGAAATYDLNAGALN